MKKLVRPLVHLLCLVPMAVMWAELLLGRIHGEWVKEVTHRTGWWGLILITSSLAITPLRRLFHWNWLQSCRRPIGLYGFFYICVHFLVIYVLLDKQVPFDPAFAWREIVKDIAKRPYITVGFTGWLLMIPLAFTSTRASIRRLGRRWAALHSLVYVSALAGVVHFMWSVKADRARPTTIGVILVASLALRLVPAHILSRLVPPRRATLAPPPEPSASQV